MNNLLGAVAQTLIDNGYAPTSAIHPGSFGHRHADEPAAILLIPSYGDGASGLPTTDVGALTVAVRDPKAREEVLRMFGKLGFAKSPTRKDSAGNLTFIFALNAYEVPASSRSKPFKGEFYAVISLDTFTRNDLPKSYAVNIEGEWLNGSPLTVKREKLPTLENSDIEALFREVETIVNAGEPAYKPAQLSPEMQAAIKRKRQEREELEAAFAECTDFEILRLVDARRPKKKLGDGAWTDLPPEALKRQTVELYQAIVAEREDAAKLAAHRRKLGIGV
jgi:hypothetical protein